MHWVTKFSDGFSASVYHNLVEILKFRPIILALNIISWFKSVKKGKIEVNKPTSPRHNASDWKKEKKLKVALL